MCSDIEYLEQFCDEISPKEFYRIIFPENELDIKNQFNKFKYTAVAVCINSDRVVRKTITNDLDIIDELCATNDFCITSPISYAGKSRKSCNARYMYALAIDLDGLKQEIYEDYPIGISTLFYQFDGYGPSNYLPRPTMIVHSGTGLHLYYVFEKPIPLFTNIVEQLEKYKHRLTWQLWTQGVSDLQSSVQYESLFQGFRMPGTITKKGDRARAFLVGKGEKVTMEYMNEFVPDEYRTLDFIYKSKLTLAEAKEKYPEWYQDRVIDNKPKGHWTCKRDLYDWWKRKIYDAAEDGHRYWCIMTLSTYAVKCGISTEELEKDALGFVDILHERGKREDNPFTVNDVLSAIDAYDISYITYPIDTIVNRTGIQIQKNKRNYRKQEAHLYLARRKKEDMKVLGEIVNEGRPSKENIVKEWKNNNPTGRKIDCIRETGLSKPTVYKYWNLIK